MKIKFELEEKELEIINDNLRSIEVDLHTILLKEVPEDLKEYVKSALRSLNNIIDITDTN